MARWNEPWPDRFWSKVDRSGECWVWTRSTRKGYGQVWYEGGREGAHRLSWIMANGPIPEGMFVCHRCDNPPCVRPDHLFLGTVKDNGVDMASKDRGRHQNANFRAWQAERRAEAESLVVVRGWPHGLETGYSYGCRDACCKQALADAALRRKRGIPAVRQRHKPPTPPRPCQAEGCTRVGSLRRGMCGTCYSRWRLQARRAEDHAA